MTENEAIKILKYYDEQPEFLSKDASADFAFKMAIQALEEIQQYRAIGTIEEFKALKEKSVAKKPIKYDKYYYKCPVCNEDLGVDDDSLYVYGDIPLKNCLHCGQELDWQ